MGERLLLEIPHLPRRSWNWQCASFGNRNVGRCSKTRLWASMSQRSRWARTWLTSAPKDTSRCSLHFILSHSITCMLNVSVSCRGHDMLSKLLRFLKGLKFSYFKYLGLGYSLNIKILHILLGFYRAGFLVAFKQKLKILAFG